MAQLRRDRQRYEGWVPADYDAYCRAMVRSGEWGDHVTLQVLDWGDRLYFTLQWGSGARRQFGRGACFLLHDRHIAGI